jgi:hypothetical protein
MEALQQAVYEAYMFYLLAWVTASVGPSSPQQEAH